MKTWLLIFVLSCQAIDSYSHASIKGKITDGEQALSFATVLLLSTDSTLVKGSITDDAGKYIFENVVPGNYLISSSMIGYSKIFSKIITVESSNIILADFILETSTTELGEVVVKAEKPLFEQYADRLVVNVQSSITSSGNTILEVLQKSPGVIVNRQTNTIGINGKFGVKIMINEKLMQVPLEVAVQMLGGMSSSNVERIELITNPQAKYDADGSAGIIHIITKENSELGTNGSVGLMLGARWAEALGGNFTLSHRTNKFAYALDYSIVRDHNLHITNIGSKSINNGFEQTINDTSDRENVTTQQNMSAGFEWKLSNNSTLNMLFTSYGRNWNMNAVNNDIHHISTDSTFITNMNIRESNIWQSATGAIGLHIKLDPKNEINFNADYLYYHNNNPSSYDNRLFYEQLNITEFSKIDLKKTTPIHFIIGKADYLCILSPSVTFETGFKIVASTLNNDVLTQRLTNNVWTTDNFFTSNSNLNEQIGAAYIFSKWKAGSQWQMNGGLRYEYTHTSISTPSQQNLINRKYGYLFPAFSLTRDLGEERDFQFSYSRRIARPTYNDIAPYVFFWGTNTFSAGNTSLWPAISDAVKVGYRMKQWNTSLQYSHSKNEIIAFQAERDNKYIIYRSQNLESVNTIGFTNSYSINVMHGWETQGSITAQHQTARTSRFSNNESFSLYGVNINVTNVFRLPNDFAFEVSGFYQSKLLAGIATYLPFGSLNAGVQKKLGEKSVLKLSIDDMFNTNNWRIETSLPEENLIAHFNCRWNNRFARVTFTHNLGNNKLRSVKSKSGSEEERRRVN